MMTWLPGGVAEVWIVASALAVLAGAAFAIPGITRVFLLAQVLYWSMSYIARPVLLLVVAPQPQFGDNVADPRLYSIGYDLGIAHALRPVAFGMWFYALLVAAFALWVRLRPNMWAFLTRPLTGNRNLILTMWVCYGIGSAARLSAWASGVAGSAGETQSSNPVLDLVGFFAAVGALGLIVYVDSPRRWVTVAVICGLSAGELLWSVLSESKTPVLGAALAIAVRFAAQGWNWRKTVGILVIAVLGVGGFGWLQSFKATPEDRLAATMVDAAYPASVRPYLSIFRRFDLLEAATDTYYLAGEHWLTPGLYLSTGLKSLIPSQLLGAEKLQSGTAWAQQVRGVSVDMTDISVSLAEGNVNEGYAVAGYPGIVFVMTATFALLVFGVYSLGSGRIVLIVAVGMAIVEYPILFERGYLGIMENLGKTLQAGIAVWIIGIGVRLLTRPASVPHIDGLLGPNDLDDEHHPTDDVGRGFVSDCDALTESVGEGVKL